jgi:myo-inositol-1(or 4)-monophosphatase
MRSANLNIMIKSLEKATMHVSRDFVELENLQLNPPTANKFCEACIRKIKKILIDDLTKIRANHNLIFTDGEKIIRSEDAEYAFLINPLDGVANLMRGGPDFTTSIALEFTNKEGKKEVIAVAIIKIIGGETYYCEKGFGAFVNNRRLRVSKRTNGELLAASNNLNLVLDKKLSLRNYGCESLNVVYVASAKIEKAFFEKNSNQFLTSLFLLVKEAGGRIIQEENSVVVSN